MDVGAVAAPLAPSFPVLMGARVLQGVGAAAVPVRPRCRYGACS